MSLIDCLIGPSRKRLDHLAIPVFRIRFHGRADETGNLIMPSTRRSWLDGHTQMDTSSRCSFIIRILFVCVKWLLECPSVFLRWILSHIDDVREIWECQEGRESFLGWELGMDDRLSGPCSWDHDAVGCSPWPICDWVNGKLVHIFANAYISLFPASAFNASFHSLRQTHRLAPASSLFQGVIWFSFCADDER